MGSSVSQQVFWIGFIGYIALEFLKQRLMEALFDEKVFRKIQYGLIMAMAGIGLLLIWASV